MAQPKAFELQNKETYYSSPTNWGLFFGSVFFFMSILFASVAVFPAYSLSIGSTPFQAGLQNTVFGFSAVFLRLFLGPVMDRRGLQPMMLLGAFSFATSPLLVMLNPTFGMLMVARVYQSLGLTIFLPGMSALTAEMAPAGRIGTFIGGTRIFVSLGLFAGPSGALLIVERFGYHSWFIVSSVICALSFLFLYFVKTPAVKNISARSKNALSGLKEALADKQIYPVIACIAIYAFSYSAIISFSAVHIEIAAPGREAAYFFAIMGLTGIAACLGTGALSDRLGRRKVAWPLLVTVGVGAIAFSFLSQWPALLVLCAVLLGAGIQGSALVFVAWLIDISKPELRATTISIQENTIDIFFALGALAFGMAAQGPGLGVAFMATGILTIITVLPLSLISAAIIKRNHQ